MVIDGLESTACPQFTGFSGLPACTELDLFPAAHAAPHRWVSLSGVCSMHPHPPHTNNEFGLLRS